MDPFSTMITGKLIDITWDAFGPSVKAYISRLFSKKNLTDEKSVSELEHADGIALGVAIGYFHNFLKPLDETIASERLLLYSTRLELNKPKDTLSASTIAEIGEEAAKQMSLEKTEKHELLNKYDPYHFKLSIIYPQNLGKQNFNRVNDYLGKETQKGSFYNRSNSRPYGINYNVTDGEIVHIFDYARPIEAIWKYYKDDKGFSQDEIDKVQAEEIRLFLAVIRRLMEDNTRHLFPNSEYIAIK